MSYGLLWEKFMGVLPHLWIDSKEEGLVTLRGLDSSGKIIRELRGTQLYFLNQVFKGLEEGIHEFWVLKGRQDGMTTACLSLDLFWLNNFGGLQGAMISDTSENRAYFKSIIDQYYKDLPKPYKFPAEINNRDQLVLQNRSRLSYLVAGIKRANNRLGQAKGLNLLHATEIFSWADQEGMASLQNSLAQTFPHRLYIFEGTAQGFNLAKDFWEEGLDSPTARSLFIGWWRNEKKAIPQDSTLFKIYWDGKLTSDEKEWVEEVKTDHGFDITPEQIAWWRWMIREKQKSMEMMHQENPPTPRYAFIMSGSAFFSNKALTEARLNAELKIPKTFRYSFGFDHLDIKVHPTNAVNADLKIWEDPVPGSRYVLGADSAYAASDRADASAISVFRCYADRAVQIAEFRSRAVNTERFAWVMLHLCGMYGEVTINLEVSGPGQDVLARIFEIQRQPSGFIRGNRSSLNFMDVYGTVQHLLYNRPDVISSGKILHFKTSGDSKPRLMESYLSSFENKYIIINSLELLNEMQYVTRDGNSIEAEGNASDDRVIAAALANLAWREMGVRDLCLLNNQFQNMEEVARNEKIFNPQTFMEKYFLKGYGDASQRFTGKES